MGITLFVPAAIYSLHTTELILTVFAALLTGFLLKMLMGQWRKGAQKNESQELQTELETLQHRFSAEMIRKEEVEKVLEEEIKAGEMRNVELQVQYAKALHFVEMLRSGNGENGDHELETTAGQQILHNLQDKITRQERQLLELEQQLGQAVQSRDSINSSYQELYNNGEEFNIHVKKIEAEKNELNWQLQQLRRENTALQERYESDLQTLKHDLSVRQEQLLELEQKSEAQINNESTLQQLINELQTQQKNTNTDELSLQKEGIATIQSSAGVVASSIDQFRDHLTNILRDAYSYEQLLVSHERLQESIQKLQEEMRLNEAQLKQLQSEKAELEKQYNHKSEEWKSKEESRLNQTMLLESTLLHLREELTNRENQMEELQVDKNNMETTFAELQQKYAEKERMAREMMTVARDMERKFAHFYKTSNGETLHQEREEIQLR